MGVGNLPRLYKTFNAGTQSYYPGSTNQPGTGPEQQVVVGTLTDIVKSTKRKDIFTGCYCR